MIFKGRYFMTTQEVLACVHQKGFQTFVETSLPTGTEMAAFRKRIRKERFGWKKWTTFQVTTPEGQQTYYKTHYYWCFERPKDAVHFKLLWS
jgi:hypothetical protein